MSWTSKDDHGRQAILPVAADHRPTVSWLLVLFVIVAVLAVERLSAAESGAPPAALVAHLQYREVDYAPLAWEVRVERVTHFSREPVYSGPRVFRGVLRLGSDTNAFVPFAWDERQLKLYVDLNRNGDLVDDPAGVFTAKDGGLQLFRDIPLQFGSESGPYQVKVDAHVFEQGSSSGEVRVFLYVRSIWDGAIELNGKKWYVAIIDRPDGRIGPAVSAKEISDRMVLRPWEQRDKPFLWWHASLRQIHDLSHVKLVTFPYRYAGNAEVFDAFNLSANVFLDGQAYRMNYQIERPGAQAGLALSFQPFQTPLGKLHCGGDSIRRVVLDGGGSPDGITAVLDTPAADVQVPLGVYGRQLVLLERAGGTNIAVGLGTNALTVLATNETRLDAGAPLRNSVEIGGISEDIVSLHYRLASAGDVRFYLAWRDEKVPPQLTIRQRGAVVGHGRFEFG